MTRDVYYTHDGEVKVAQLCAQCNSQLRPLGQDEDKKPHEEFFVLFNDGDYQGALILIRSRFDSAKMLRMRTSSQNAITWLAGALDGVCLSVA